ncbi:hypothetical protein SADUNF_Sadunf13G0000700 [Salix dunnii]|uniref:GST C-terminal domain-containing protein n=1 Tax=Salix dunnii TaxID=1413687 RepID=A0A835MKD7_9ROSI|nr:hypothetical protein SADUNF_Sadunf13G0000700 [Salix dunnii]
MEIKDFCFASDSTPPLSVISAARVASLTLPPPTTTATDSAWHYHVCLHIDRWLDYAPVLSVGTEFENACNFIDNYLESRPFLVEHSLSIADIAVWSSLAGNGLRWEGWRKSKKFPNLVRWFNSTFDEYSDALSEVLSRHVWKKHSGKPAAPKGKQVVSGDNPEKGKASSRPLSEIGKVCLRFAPEPSGYLHIGHSIAALLNQYFAQRYQGQMIIQRKAMNL